MSILVPERQPNRRAEEFALDIMPSEDGFEAAFDESMARNPTPTILRWLERQQYQGYTDEFGIEQQAPTPSRILTPEEANNEYGIDGELKFDTDTPEPIARQLRKLKQEEIERREVLRRSGAGFGTQLTAGLVASILDPVNIASAFVPVVSPARFAALTARYGQVGGRAIVGATEGAVGAALVEPIVYAGAQAEQADYDAVDSLVNLAFGTALGAGLHLGIYGLGHLGDIPRNRDVTDSDAPESISLDEIRPEPNPTAVLREFPPAPEIVRKYAAVRTPEEELDFWNDPGNRAALKAAAVPAPRDMVVYRGTTADLDERRGREYFTSTSLDPSWAETMASARWHNPALIAIQIKKGTPIIPVNTGDMAELEILLPPEVRPSIVERRTAMAGHPRFPGDGPGDAYDWVLAAARVEAPLVLDKNEALQRATPLQRAVESMKREDQEAALRTAVAQVAQGEPVNVTPVLDAVLRVRGRDGTEVEFTVDRRVNEDDTSDETSVMSAPDPNGYVHKIEWLEKSNHYQVVESRLGKDLRGKGIGIQLYRKLIDEALSKGKEFWSDDSVSSEALKIYQALESRGYTVEYNPHIRGEPHSEAMIKAGEREPGGVQYTSNKEGRPVVKVIKGPVDTPPTPPIKSPDDIDLDGIEMKRLVSESPVGPPKELTDQIAEVEKEIGDLQSIMSDAVNESQLKAMNEIDEEGTMLEKAFIAAGACQIRNP